MHCLMLIWKSQLKDGWRLWDASEFIWAEESELLLKFWGHVFHICRLYQEYGWSWHGPVAEGFIIGNDIGYSMLEAVWHVTS